MRVIYVYTKHKNKKYFRTNMVFFILRPRQTQMENEVPTESLRPLLNDETAVKKERAYYSYDFDLEKKQKLDDMYTQLELLKKQIEEFKKSHRITKEEYTNLKPKKTETNKKPSKQESSDEEKAEIQRQKDAERLETDRIKAQEKANKAIELKREADRAYKEAITKWEKSQDEIEQITNVLKGLSEKLKEKEEDIITINANIIRKIKNNKDISEENGEIADLNKEIDNIKLSIEDEDNKIQLLRLINKPEKPGGKEIILDSNAITYPALLRGRDIQYIIKTKLWEEKTKIFCDSIPMNSVQEIYDASDAYGLESLKYMKIFFKSAMSGSKEDRILAPFEGKTEEDVKEQINRYWFSRNGKFYKATNDNTLFYNTETIKKLFMLAFKTVDLPLSDDDIFKKFAMDIFIKDYFQKSPINEISDDECWDICSADEKENILQSIQKPKRAAPVKANAPTSILPSVGEVLSVAAPKTKSKRTKGSTNSFEILKEKWEALPESEQTPKKARLYLHAAARFFNYSELTNDLEDDNKYDFSNITDTKTKAENETDLKKKIDTSNGVWKKGIVSGQKFFFGDQNTNGVFGNKNDERLLFFSSLYLKAFNNELFDKNKDENTSARTKMSTVFKEILYQRLYDQYGTRQETENEFPELTELVSVKKGKGAGGEPFGTRQNAAEFNYREIAIRAARAKLIGL